MRVFEVNADAGEIFLYDEIGSSWFGGISSSDVIRALADMPGKDLTVRINSPGGDVVEAIAIYNALDRHQGKVTVTVDALAASAGSYIAMVGDEIVMSANAMMMIHSPWTFAMGNSTEMRKTADLLDKFEGSLITAYAEQAKKNDSQLREILQAETWYTAAEAVREGFATRVGEKVEAYASVAPGRFAKTPEQFVCAGVKRFAAGINRQQPAEPPRKESPLLQSAIERLAQVR